MKHMGKSKEDFANHERFVWELINDAKPPKTASKCTDYIHRLTQGMQAKKYKGGVAMKAKISSNKLFDRYFKPLEGTCQK